MATFFCSPEKAGATIVFVPESYNKLPVEIAENRLQCLPIHASLSAVPRREKPMRNSFEDMNYMSLSAPERLLLAQELLDSVYDSVAQPQWTAEQSVELHGRSGKLESGQVRGIPWGSRRESFLNGQ
jgi:putative addiction module component (TIGR02574 family)